MTEMKANEHHKFLLYIVERNVKFKNEAVTITFFKDITFGVLYE